MREKVDMQIINLPHVIPLFSWSAQCACNDGYCRFHLRISPSPKLTSPNQWSWGGHWLTLQNGQVSGRLRSHHKRCSGFSTPPFQARKCEKHPWCFYTLGECLQSLGECFCFGSSRKPAQAKKSSKRTLWHYTTSFLPLCCSAAVLPRTTCSWVLRSGKARE